VRKCCFVTMTLSNASDSATFEQTAVRALVGLWSDFWEHVMFSARFRLFALSAACCCVARWPCRGHSSQLLKEAHSSLSVHDCRNSKGVESSRTPTTWGARGRSRIPLLQLGAC
jgi:hypothetical protein